MKITLVKNSENSKLVLIGSFNHISFDATTFYSIWGMINKNSEIFSLNRNSVQSFDQSLRSETSLIPENHDLDILAQDSDTSVSAENNCSKNSRSTEVFTEF